MEKRENENNLRQIYLDKLNSCVEMSAGINRVPDSKESQPFAESCERIRCIFVICNSLYRICHRKLSENGNLER